MVPPLALRDRVSVLPSGVALPAGELRYVYLHWSGGDDAQTYDAYHLCIARDARDAPYVALTHDPRDNMRDVSLAPTRPYAAHTAGRNAYALGVAVCGMRDATPHDFGAFALRDDAVALMCEAVARACAFYEIPIDAEHVATHAEAAVHDGYFGAGTDERWDIARLRPDARPLDRREARDVGDALRARIRASI